jgi:hypothetical protein
MTEMSKAAIVWHYTTGEKLTSILADGEIVPSTVGLAIDPAAIETLGLTDGMPVDLDELNERIRKTGVRWFQEQPAVWFTKRPTWEPTASKGRGGLARIGVHRAGLTTWAEHRKTSGIDPGTARGLVLAARDVGSNPGDWFAYYDAVPRTMWVAIQRWRAGSWKDVAPEGKRR